MTRARWYRDLPYRALWVAFGWLLVVAIVLLSLSTVTPFGPDVPHGDKYRHVLAYATLAFWFTQIVATRGGLLVHAVGFALLGVALEGFQFLTSARQFEVLDMLANALGVALGLCAGSGRRRHALACALAAFHRSR